MVTAGRALHLLLGRAVRYFWQTPRGSRGPCSPRRERAHPSGGFSPEGSSSLSGAPGAGPAAQPRHRHQALSRAGLRRGPMAARPRAAPPAASQWRAGPESGRAVGERPLGSSGSAPVGGARRARPGPARRRWRRRRCGAGASGAAGRRS